MLAYLGKPHQLHWKACSSERSLQTFPLVVRCFLGVVGVYIPERLEDRNAAFEVPGISLHKGPNHFRCVPCDNPDLLESGRKIILKLSLLGWCIEIAV